MCVVMPTCHRQWLVKLRGQRYLKVRPNQSPLSKQVLRNATPFDHASKWPHSRSLSAANFVPAHHIAANNCCSNAATSASHDARLASFCCS